MPRTTATTVDEYLETLPEDRRAVIAAMRALIRENISDGYRESMIAFHEAAHRTPKKVRK
jgi:Arc/MetJ family transcription regulator